MKRKGILLFIAAGLCASGILIPLALHQLPTSARIIFAASDLGAAAVVVLFAIKLPSQK